VRLQVLPGPVEIRLEPGVAMADALIWAAGSLAPSELRAEKPDDVVFSGSATRRAPTLRGELLFDNDDGTE
jgi:chromosome segregation ATPase